MTLTDCRFILIRSGELLCIKTIFIFLYLNKHFEPQVIINTFLEVTSFILRLVNDILGAKFFDLLD